ncbi:MAG: M42 family metallopeptidase [Anaerolineaceae bacterium]|nr:M42 family metallopeptidase [Anaerolineaceae bacterium]
MKNLIKKLVESIGPSGYESDVRRLVQEEITDFADELRTDAMGSLIARKGTKKGNGMRIMLSAHLDEIGLVASHIDEKGFIRFSTLGGVYPRNCPGGRVRFMSGVEGVIGVERLESSEHNITIEHLYIDVGAANREDCPVKIGEVAAFHRPMLDLGNRIAAKSIDDRIGVAILIETLRQIKESPHELYFVFSVQEEVGLRGAGTAAYALDPELGLAVDVTLTGDTPKGPKMEVSLGKGPAIKIRDGRMLSDPRLIQHLVQAAQNAGLPYQLEILEGGTTDASAIQISRAGVPAGCISVPCRYVHSPSEMVDYNDVQNAVKLLVNVLSNPIQLDKSAA